MTFGELRSSVSVVLPENKPMRKPGKMFFYNGYIFINELFEGIHVVDNRNPANPIFVYFINIPGNVDIAVKDQTLYADSYVDLVSFDISDINNITVKGRNENIFDQVFPDFDVAYPLCNIDTEKGVIIDWKIERITEEIEIQNSPWMLYDAMVFSESNMLASDFSARGSNVQTTVAQGGSMARFITYKDRLYILDQWRLRVFDIADESIPQLEEISTGREAETVFISNDYLFIGTTTGMLIYSLQNPDLPEHISTLQHFRSCDPVVVQGNLAYVTLRSGTVCGSTANQLDVINISDIYNPILLKSYNMTHPQGLGIDGETLFICDGDAGLKVLDAKDPLNIETIEVFADVKNYDVIPLNGLLLMIGADGLYQYDYSDTQNLKLISTLSIMD